MKPSSNVPLPYKQNDINLQQLNGIDGNSKEDASMTHRGMVLHEHLTSIRQRSDSSDSGVYQRGILPQIC